MRCILPAGSSDEEGGSIRSVFGVAVIGKTVRRIEV